MKAKKRRHPVDSQRAKIGRRLKEARKLRGLSQIDIADAAGVTRASVSLWEAGRTTVEKAKLELAAKRLFVKYDWLATGAKKLAPDFSRTAFALERRMARRAARLDGSIPQMKDGIGTGAAYTDKVRAQEWWVIPPSQWQSLGVNSENLKAFRVAADNFEPLIVRGDVVFVDVLQRIPANNAVFAILSGPSLILKRLHTDIKRPSMLGLSDSSRRRTVWVRTKDISVIGRIVAQMRQV